MGQTVSIAIESSCRAGGVALGLDDRLARTRPFDASARHATQLIACLDELLVGEGLRPPDIDQIYVSAGPGSFTGLRIGITVARTLGQTLPGARLVAVPTPQAVADNAASLPWRHLAVILDAKGDHVYVAPFTRRGDQIIPAPPAVMPAKQFLDTSPRPVLLIGEGLWHHELAGDGVERADEERYYPTAEGVWRVGRRLAVAGEFVDAGQVLPVYAREPEAVRLWEERHGSDETA